MIDTNTTETGRADGGKSRSNALLDFSEDNTGNGTVKDYARVILKTSEMSTLPDELRFWSEISMIVDGHKVNMESVITYVDGVKCGPMYETPKKLPKWKLAIKKILSI